MAALIEKNNLTVLVTGGAGFIGSHLVRKLLQQNCQVYVVDNLSTGSFENLPVHPRLNFIRGSVMDVSCLRSLKHVSFHLILHLASVVGMRLATRYKLKTYDIATIGTKNVLRIFPGIPVVLFSSSAVYGLYKLKQVKETDHAKKEELLEYDGGSYGYACGKREMECIGLDELAKRKILILRPFNVIGERQVGNYGMVVPTFVSQAFKGLPITILGNGEQVRSFSCIETFVECLSRLLEHEQAWEAHIINVGSKQGTSINQLATAVLKETGSNSIITHDLYEKIFPNHKDVFYRVPDISLGENYFGKFDWPDISYIIKQLSEVKRVSTAFV